MAIKSSLASLLAAWLLIFPLVAALQVTPDSPCSSFCLDAPDLDKADPESSNTLPEDITCRDEDFASRPEGQKFQRCLTCLQDSPYSKGHETDQQWFFYNLRYAFDYCVLGFPNVTEIESSPCVTSEACGRIEEALQDGIMEPAHAEPYGYCEIDNGAIMSTDVESCLACVRAGNSQHYMSNFLTAIQAGCDQQPVPGIVVGLSDTVFTTTPINIVAPHTSDGDGDSAGTALSTPVIAGIAVGGFVVALLLAGCVYMQIRKRKNRAARAAQRASPLEFRCQTHVTPMSPTFPGNVGSEVEEKAIVSDPAAALSSNPVGNKWHSPDSLRSQVGGLSQITTSVPKPPVPAAQQHHNSSPRMYSPDDHYHQTPTSTTSNAPLLPSFRPYVPAEYNGQPPFPFHVPGIAISTPEETSAPYFAPQQQQQQQQQRSPHIGSPASIQSSSPRMEQKGWYTRPSQAGWEPQALTIQEGGGGSRDLTHKKRAVSGSPVSVTTIQTSFPPPPPPKR